MTIDPRGQTESLSHQEFLPALLYAGRFDGANDVSWHSHEGHELILLTRGSCRQGAAGQWLQGPPGTLFVIPAGIPHYQQTQGLSSTTYATLTGAPPWFSSALRALSLGVASPAARWMEDLCDQGPHPVNTQLAGGLLLAILAAIGQAEAVQTARRAMHPALAQCLCLLEARLDRNISVLDLAKEVHLSPGHLSDLFHAQFGQGPHAYHQAQRLRRAARLLQNPYLSVAQVAAASGFADPNYFARVFRKQFGQTPGSCRRPGLPPDELVARLLPRGV